MTEGEDAPRVRLWPLRASTFLSSVDRFATAPILVTLADDLDISLSIVIQAASAYYLAYGLMQVVWGLLSDRIGRVRVMRIALCCAAVAAAASAFVTNAHLLIVARTLTGGSFAAIIPASLTYVGDTTSGSRRLRALSDMLSWNALGTAIATVLAAAIAQLLSWRLVFGLPALAAVVLVFVLRQLPEPERAPSAGPFRQLWSVLRRPWALVVLLLAFVEGGMLLGILTYFAPALEYAGVDTAMAGAITAGYGLGVVGFAQLVKVAAGRMPPAALMLIGGAGMGAGYVVAGLQQSPVTIAVAALLLGGGWSFMHTTLQIWATSMAPEARATGVALFATALFVGSATATALGAGLAETGSYSQLFLIAAAVAFVLAAVAPAFRWRYEAG